MELDFSEKVPSFEAEKSEIPSDLEEKLVSILESSMASELNEIGINEIHRMKAIFRRGSSSFDHLHLIGVSRMQLGIARVIHVLGTDKLSEKILDYDLIHSDQNCDSWDQIGRAHV